MGNWWDTYPWREIQTNLRETDMRDIRAQQVVADLQFFKATVLMINAAGIIASYPTELPFHFQSPYLTGDSLSDIIKACHDAGIRVVARTDFSKVRRPIYEMHPEWAYLTPQGEIVDYHGDIAVCLNGDYQQHYALQIIEECLNKLPFDGIFFNMGGFQTRDYSGNSYGFCHCASCRRRFDELYGMSLPATESVDDPVYRAYMQFRDRCVREHHEKIYEFIHSRWPHVIIANHREFRAGLIRQESNTAIDRALPHWQYSGSDNTKWAVSSYPAMVSSNTTVDFIDFPYRHVAVSPHQQRLRLGQALANGGALDFYLIGRLDNHADRSGFAPVREMFDYHAANEKVYTGLTSAANVGLLHSPMGNINEFRGWFRFLVEHHHCFDTIMEDVALEMSWDRYDALILPDFQAVSDALAARLDDFVSQGGALIATGRSGFRDETWAPRPKPAIAALGLEAVKLIRHDMRGSYFELNDKTHFPGMSATDLLYLDGLYIYGQYAAKAAQHMRLIPPQPFGPPERCYPSVFTGHPGYIVHAHGQGKAIHIPWLPGTLFHRQGYPNTSDFIGDLLRYTGEIERVTGNLSPMVEVTHFRSARDMHADQENIDLVHLVNTSGHFGVSFFAPVTMHELTITISYPRAPRCVTGLVAQAALEHTWADGKLTVQVPHLEQLEAICIT